MRRISPRLSINAALLCLPLAVVSFAAVFFYMRDVPRLVSNEKKRLRAEYREIAAQLKATQDPASCVKRTRGWSRTTSEGEMAPGEWGRFPAPAGGMTVWYRQGRKYYARTVPALEETDFRSLFLVGGSCVLVLLFALTLLGIRFFISETRARDDFLAATAHDLTTPLVGLRLLVRRDNPEARQAVERLLRLVGNVKDYLQSGGRRLPVVCEQVDLCAVYAEAYALFVADYRDVSGGADIPVHADGQGPWFVWADETRLVQIIWNLLANELKYAAASGPLEVRLSRTHDRVQMSFVDVGPGMSRRERQRAFDRYYRSRGAMKTGKGGFGIGLCTSREFARLMGGDLTVAANRPQGCVFTLSLPCPADSGPDGLADRKEGCSPPLRRNGGAVAPER